MATNDFIHDLVDKLVEDNIEYLVITVQKGKKEHNSNAYYNIRTVDGVDMIATTFDEVLQNIAQGNGHVEIDPEEDGPDEDSDLETEE